MDSILAYDGSFDGFLSCVFAVYEQKLSSVSIQKEHQVQHGLFAGVEHVPTKQEHANRVWEGLKKKLTFVGLNQIYYAFLSELSQVEDLLLAYIRQVFSSTNTIEKDYGNPAVLKVAKIKKSVSREKHRMEAFVRFKLTKDNLYFANIEPDFNVLPLIIKHFKRRYADQKWLIYDIKRGYGMHYNLEKVELVSIDFDKSLNFNTTSNTIFADGEFDFQQLWKDYFKSTNIESRKNTKLHLQHVPKRYWKYLVEKQHN